MSATEINVLEFNIKTLRESAKIKNDQINLLKEEVSELKKKNSELTITIQTMKNTPNVSSEIAV